MPKSVDTNEAGEPVGIIISRGDRDEPTPVCFAYVWGLPDDSEPSRAAAPRAA